MKSKYSRFFTAGLPSLIILPAMAQVANAAAILQDVSGNVVITSVIEPANSGPNNVVVSPGQPAGAHELRLEDNSFLSPSGFDSVDIQMVDGAGASYTVNMGIGTSIDGGMNDGITTVNTVGTAADLVINANGTITGLNAISGGTGLITVLNNSMITGTAGAGIISTGTLDITNLAGGVISGNTDGIDTGGDLLLDNQLGASITGVLVDGVSAADRAKIINAGTITGLNYAF